MSNFQCGWGDSKSNEGKLFPLSLLGRAFLVLHSTGGVKTKLGSIDEGLHEAILFTSQDSEFVQQD
jgi:hypothetical protein